MTARPSRTFVLGLLAALLAAGRAFAAEPATPVDLELVLAVDVSASIDPPEFELQTRGLAEAFRDPEVQAALRARGRHGIAVALMQWSGRFQQVVAIDWTLIHDAPSALAFARRIETMDRRFQAETAIANALAFGVRLLKDNRFAGARQVIDLSGDGPSNSGADPDPVRDAAVAARITINGLAIVNEIPAVKLYYADHVIGGPDAFLLVAKDFDDFAQRDPQEAFARDRERADRPARRARSGAGSRRLRRRWGSVRAIRQSTQFDGLRSRRRDGKIDRNHGGVCASRAKGKPIRGRA